MVTSENRVVIITGGGAGIGLSAARSFAERGAKVLITGRRAEPLEHIAATSPNIKGLVADASHSNATSNIVAAALAHWGRIDVVVNNAGNGIIQPLSEASQGSISDVFAVNVTAPILLAAAALPHLVATRGSIINISSTYGSKAAPGLSLYASSKAALEHLTRCWALELAPMGVRVNAVASGPVETNFLRDRMRLSDEQVHAIRDQERRMIPLGRHGEPEDISRWILHLADPEANWITGQVIAVDGGLTVT